MSNTIQYTYGLIGASASSTTIAIDWVPFGSPDQLIGGESTRDPSQVNLDGSSPRSTAALDTVITAGAVIVTPWLSSPHPANATAVPRPPQPAITRRAERFTSPILGPGPAAGRPSAAPGGATS